MPFIDDMTERDLAILQALDGREVTFIPDGGASRIISGMLQALSELVPGDSVEVVASAPILSVRVIDVPELDVDDCFIIDGKRYRAAVIKPDNEGMIEIRLEAV
jgi:hypothetical protein